jgi:2-polyprenyl-6-methoxyphenol hydroxylase-like FAD-dependent oxidoreductase
MSQQPRALIIGGSIGGLFAAHLLRDIGWDVAVFERSADNLASRGTGIGGTPALLAVMQRIGIALDSSIWIAIRSRICLDRDGSIAAEAAIPARATGWAKIYQALKTSLPSQYYRANTALGQVVQDGLRVTAKFEDGSEESGDLLVAADGMYSTVRQQVLPRVTPRYAGYVVWRGALEERETPVEVQTQLFDRTTFCLPDGELFLAMPNPGADLDIRPGRRRYYFVWYRPADYEKTLRQLCTDAAGRQHGVTIPPPLIRPEVIRDLKASAEKTLAPQLAAVVVRTEQPLLHGVFDLESPQLVFGRVALLGDAAFTARPHVVAGVTKAALDAQSLADALIAFPGDLELGLAQYDRAQRELGSRLVARGRYLGAYLEAQSSMELERSPETVIREYGSVGAPGVGAVS